MFTKKNDIEKILGVTGLTYIDKGVMTDKYEYTEGGISYIARCYPEDRSFLADAEFYYMQQFKRLKILAPEPIKYVKNGKTAVLVYKKLEGTPLSDVWTGLTKEEKLNSCKQIVANYKAINSIECEGVGRMRAYNVFSHDKWSEFENSVEADVRRTSGSDIKGDQLDDFIENWFDMSSAIDKDAHRLVWSDFSQDNIIVNVHGELAGFVDFEGLMSGDYLLGVGYMMAHENDSEFAQMILNEFGLESKNEALMYYAQLRYLRIFPYRNLPLPNGEKRDKLEDYLPYVKNQIKDMSFREKISTCFWLRKTIVLSVCVIACVLAFWGSFVEYETVLQNGEVGIAIDSTICQKISGDVPIWCKIEKDSMKVRRGMEMADKLELYALMERTSENDTLVTSYRQFVDKISYESSNSQKGMGSLILLTLCLVVLGCSARTFFDYIGNVCYKKERQNMARWWPWYIFRLFIGAPIAAFMLVAFRCAMFSSLFMTKDLNTYLVVSFLAGFAMMEFLEMLRGVSKGLFGKFNN